MVYYFVDLTFLGRCKILGTLSAPPEPELPPSPPASRSSSPAPGLKRKSTAHDSDHSKHPCLSGVPSSSISVRMANPSSSHHDHDERERCHRSDRHSTSHHHHRTISSTTLLLVLSLILAVLAVMLSLPSNTASAFSKEDPAAQGVWGYLTPKRPQALITHKSAVAAREAKVACREAELLVGAPSGVIPTQTPCPVCPTEPAQTIIKEVVQESALAAPSWFKEAGIRAEEISKCKESVNRREYDASRRESWIMEQLM